jgi:outer membrane protease
MEFLKHALFCLHADVLNFSKHNLLLFIPYVSLESKEIPYVSIKSKEIPYVSMESKKLHTLEWKVRNYMRQHEQQQVMF